MWPTFPRCQYTNLHFIALLPLSHGRPSGPMFGTRTSAPSACLSAYFIQHLTKTFYTCFLTSLHFILIFWNNDCNNKVGDLSRGWANSTHFCQWSGRPGFNPMSSHTKDSKMVFDAALLSTQCYKIKIKGKVEQTREWSSALFYTLVL